MPVDFLGRCTTNAPRDKQPPLRSNITAVLYPGFMATMGEASKYVGEEGISVLRRRRRRPYQQGRKDHKVCSSSSSSPFPPSHQPEGQEDEDDDNDADGRWKSDTIVISCRHSPRLLHNVMPCEETFETREGWGVVTGRDEEDGLFNQHPPHIRTVKDTVIAFVKQFVLSVVHCATAIQLYIQQRFFFRLVVRRGRRMKPTSRATEAERVCPSSSFSSSMPFVPIPILHNRLLLNNMGGYSDQAACLKRVEEGMKRVGALNHLRGGDDTDGRSSTSQQKQHHHHLVLFGFSRGATTMLFTALKMRGCDRTYPSTSSLPPPTSSSLLSSSSLSSSTFTPPSLLVLEAPFDTVRGVLRDAWPRAHRGVYSTFHRLCADDSGGGVGGGDSVGGDSDEDDGAYAFPPETDLSCPIAFITSEADATVKRRTTQRCIDKLLSTYPNRFELREIDELFCGSDADKNQVENTQLSLPLFPIYHLRLKTSAHPLMALGEDGDRMAYIAFMEALYRRYCPPPSSSK